MLIVLTTVPNEAEGESLATELVESKLAACVQILPSMTSIYIWEGMIVNEKEHLLLIKTQPERWESVRDLVAEKHPYDIPEIVAIDAEKASEPYLKWMKETLA